MRVKLSWARQHPGVKQSRPRHIYPPSWKFLPSNNDLNIAFQLNILQSLQRERTRQWLQKLGHYVLFRVRASLSDSAQLNEKKWRKKWSPGPYRGTPPDDDSARGHFPNFPTRGVSISSWCIYLNFYLARSVFEPRVDNRSKFYLILNRSLSRGRLVSSLYFH